jgi:(E)-4-hydroxy-3-methylbut-2-enyl-diphosphate synthase
MKIAVMGCVVNGIGESENADIGIAGVKGGAVIFKNGKIIGNFSEEEILEKLLRYIELLR